MQTFFFFFQTKLFQKFFKLLSKIVMAYLCHCSFRPRNTSGENITGKNPVRLFSSFCVQSNFRFSPLFCSVKNPFNFYFSTCLISLRYRESLSCKGNRFSYLLIFVGRKSLSLLRFISFMVKRHEPFKEMSLWIITIEITDMKKILRVSENLCRVRSYILHLAEMQIGHRVRLQIFQICPN